MENSQQEAVFFSIPLSKAEPIFKNWIREVIHENQNKNQPESDQLLNIQAAASLINLTVPTLYGLVAKALIPYMKKNKRLYFSKQELIMWIKTGKRKTIAETHTEAENFLTNHKSGKDK